MRLAADIIDAIRAVPTGSGDCHMVVLFGLGRGVPFDEMAPCGPLYLRQRAPPGRGLRRCQISFFSS